MSRLSVLFGLVGILGPAALSFVAPHPFHIILLAWSIVWGVFFIKFHQVLTTSIYRESVDAVLAKIKLKTREGSDQN